jgi:DNA-binding winged helix-turn-helix (wHTH) protein/TolB-like protein/Tfp pilus assembly protein PilF
MNGKALHFYEFADFRLDVTERVLWRDSETVALTPKVFDTLLFLVQNSGHILTKDELMQTLWPDSFVEESSLTQNISLLRRALGQNASESLFIETIPKRGYRFVSEVREIQDAKSEVILRQRTTAQISVEEQIEDDLASREAPALPPAPARKTFLRPRIFAAGISSLVIFGALFSYLIIRHRAPSFEAKSIAVLPFKTIGTQSTDLEGLGIADAVINRLSKLNQTKVLPTSSISRYTNREKEAIEIGRELGVDAVLDGSLQREGTRIRVTAQLISLTDGRTLWTAKYDEEYRGTFVLQDSISGQLAPALASELGNNNRQPVVAGMTDNAEAYQAYLTGTYFWNKRTKEGLTKAIQYLQHAVELDQNFGLAHAVLADCYYLSVDTGYDILPLREAITRAAEETQKALAIDERIPEAHVVNAALRMFYRDPAAAEREFRRALELNPNSAVAHMRYGYRLFAERQLELSLQHMKLAQQLDPVSVTTNSSLGFLYSMMREDETAVAYFKRAIEIEPEVNVARFNLIEKYIAKHKFDEAREEMSKLKDPDPIIEAGEKAYLFGTAGQFGEAKRILDQVAHSKDAERLRPIDYVGFYAAMGDKDGALAWLEKTNTSNAFLIASLTFDSRYDMLRSDPRFTEFLKRHQ